jgi:dipeptidyl aminopeptidase/acylaminoacyl peptidase
MRKLGMMKCAFFFLLGAIYLDSHAQKPALDTSVFGKWSYVGGGVISDDGLYVCFNEFNNSNTQSDLFIQAMEGDWSFRLRGVSTAKFTPNSKFVFFKKTGDSLFALRLGTSNSKFIATVSTYELCIGSSLVIYKSSEGSHQITLHSLTGQKNTVLDNTESYLCDPQENKLLFLTQIDSSHSSLILINLSNTKRKVIFLGSANQQVVSYTFDKSGENIAFITKEKKDGESKNILWLYRSNIDSVLLIADDQSHGVDSTLQLATQKPEFSPDGRFIFFGLTCKPRIPSGEQTAVPVKIWSYLDAELEPVAEERRKRQYIYLAAVSITGKNIIRLELENENIISRSNDVVLIRRSMGFYGLSENNWNSVSRFSFSLIFLQNGSRTLLKDQLINPEEYLTMSPDGKWIFYFDFAKKNYYSYELLTGAIRNLTGGIENRWTEVRNDHPEPSLPLIPQTESWLSTKDLILIEDSYDIWLVDPSGKRKPANITNGYGRRHHLKFRPLDEASLEQSFADSGQSTLILRAISDMDHTWYFFKKQINCKGEPTLLSKGSYVYGGWGGHGNIPRPPDKAKHLRRYLISRMTAISAPNYFITDDFSHFRQISDIQPQKQYNWLTTEEVRWKTFEGTYSQGILYKPEIFNPRQQYPVIFDYYETRSDELNLFITPKPSSDRINIPWFVSHGYLVFVPDIHYKVGHPGQSVYNSVVSAARYLAKFPWVDSKHMGLQGHSFGGYETNYLVTHTHIFAAACSASGFSDLVSLYGSVARGSYHMYAAERNQDRIGTTMWKAPDLYIENSPIYKADKITTPLLLMHGKDDRIVPFSQSVEFFMALRRLSKIVWLLEYDGSDHTINGYQSSIDFTTRMTQFFDHYLKNIPAPTWMSGRIN